MGNPHHAGPHVAALEALGVAPGEIARVHRPIGLNIGSRTPPEIAISTLAGLLADRNPAPAVSPSKTTKSNIWNARGLLRPRPFARCSPLAVGRWGPLARGDRRRATIRRREP